MLHCASNRFARPQDFLHSALELLGTTSVPHDPGYFNDIIQAQVATVPDVLLLQKKMSNRSADFRHVGEETEGNSVSSDSNEVLQPICKF